VLNREVGLPHIDSGGRVTGQKKRVPAGAAALTGRSVKNLILYLSALKKIEFPVSLWQAEFAGIFWSVYHSC
jgi:hypothetical protein